MERLCLRFVALLLLLLAAISTIDARVLGFAQTGSFAAKRLQHKNQQEKDIGCDSDQIPTRSLSSLDVATIDADELWDVSDYISDNIRIANVISAETTVLTRKSLNSSLVWTIVTAALSISAIVNTGALGSLIKLSSVFFAWYLSLLESSPLITKCITGGLIAFTGDYGAQWFEWRSRGLAKQRGTYNIRRGLARFFECLLISSPLMHYGYDLFEALVPTIGGGSALYRSFAALLHVLADCVLLDAIFVMTGIICTGLMEGQKFRHEVIPNLRRVYFPTLKASICTCGLLAPLQFISFRFLPLSLRVLSVNAVDLIWNGVVSFVSHER